MSRRSGLGRGLSALIPQATDHGGELYSLIVDSVGEVLSLIQLESAWCRGYMMLQADACAIERAVQLRGTRLAPGESMRVFPLSNWTELDIWQYIMKERIEIVPLYMAAPRPTVERDGLLLMVDDERFPLEPGEVPEMRSIRFRTLGCYPLTGAVESDAATLPEIIREMLLTTTSERQGRAIDHDQAASMEKKKQEGYF